MASNVRIIHTKNYYNWVILLQVIIYCTKLSDNSDDCMSAVFIPLDKATENVYFRFYKYVYD